MAEASKDSAKMDVDKAAPADKDKEKEKEKAPVDPNKLTIADINASLTLIRRGVASQEDRFMVRVVRLVPRLRKRLNANVLHAVIQKHFVGADAQKTALLAYLPAPTEPVETQAAPVAATTTAGAAAPAAPAPILPEAEIYIHTLVVIFLIDSEKHAEAVECAERLIARAVETKRRSSDVLCARAYFYFARAHELNNSMSAIRSTLHAALRAASIRCDEPGQATLINLLLHNYLSENLVEQADVLVSKAPFPESATNNDAARYLFYLGRIRAIQLDYSEAHRHLVQAIRKAPKSAVGFLQTVNKLAVIVQLLLGEIPERDLFRHADLQRSLAPYFKLTQAVRVGDLGRFNDVIQTFGDRFQADKTYKLILRLRHNVIKTGVRMISLSYSRISFADISAKLQLGSADDAEYIVAKAIRDGVIDATINHEEGCVRSKEVVDIYSTNEPQDAFHQRIAFCLKLHNDSVKAMRYSRNAYRKYLETPEQRREREMQEEEIARDLDDKDD